MWLGMQLLSRRWWKISMRLMIPSGHWRKLMTHQWMISLKYSNCRIQNAIKIRTAWFQGRSSNVLARFGRILSPMVDIILQNNNKYGFNLPKLPQLQNLSLHQTHTYYPHHRWSGPYAFCSHWIFSGLHSNGGECEE